MAAPPITERHLHHFHRRSPIKEAVRVATTANITLSGAQTIDGIAAVAGDRALVKDQTAASGNGLYDVAAGAWTRAYDQSTDDPAFGFLVRVREGTVNASKVYANTNTSAPTIDSTSIAFAEIGAGSALTIKDEGGALATAATSIDFVGAGVVASGTGAAKTVTVSAALDDLTDVTITSVATADRLRFDGSVWRNSGLVWKPVMVLDPTSGNYLPVTTGAGEIVMTEAL